MATRLMLVGLPEAQARPLRESISDLAADGGFVQDWRKLELGVRRSKPDVVAIYLGPRPGQVLALVKRVRAMSPSTVWIAIATQSTPSIVQSVTAAGCVDLVVLSDCPDDLQRSVMQLTARDAPAKDVNGTVYAVLGAKGGQGTTVVAANLAGDLAAREGRTILVDLHVYLGDAAVVLGIRPRPSALWFLHRGAMADERTWMESPPSHSAGFKVLGLDGNLATADQATPEQVVFLSEALKRRYEHVVIDCGNEVNEISLAACSMAEHRFIVLTDELAARTGAQRRREALKALDPDIVPARAILNRAHQHTVEYRTAVEQAIKLPIVGMISNGWQDMQAALARGQLVRQANPRSPVARDFKALADTIAGADQQEAKRQKAFFNFFR